MERADLEQWKAREVARLLALVESERRYYQEIAASIPVGLLVLSPDFAILSANRAIRKIFGLIGSPLRARLDTLLPAWVLDRVGEVLRTGAPQTNILLPEPKTGRRLRIGILAIRSWDDESEHEALLSIEDLTGLEPGGVPVPVLDPTRPAAELIDNLNAVVWTLELDSTRFLFVSRNAASLLGYPLQHWTGNPSFWTDRVYAGDRDWVTQSYRQAIQRGDRHACEFRAETADGRIVWLRESARLVTDSAGRPRYLLGVTVDITERRLLEDQLVQSERVQAVSKLAGRMAHDLNNMLMLVIGHSEELQTGLPANSPLRAEVQAILDATGRMTALASHLLAFTRRQVDAVSTVELETILRGLDQRAGLQLKLSPRPNLVQANAERLQQMVTSLVEHERQATIETSRIEINEDLRQPGAPLQPGAYGVIAITLSGRRMEGEAARSWFETLLPGKDSSDDWAAAVTRAYGIVRQWGGDMAASAAPVEGTVLRLFLSSPTASAGTKPVPEVAPVSTEAHLARVLVVDDEPGIRTLIYKILNRHGYEVIEAANGEEALAICREHPARIDLLITDVMMPRMGGPELVERLRQQGLDMKVLYVSGYTDDPKIYAGKFPPGTALLEKPFTLTALLDKVREVLGSPR